MKILAVDIETTGLDPSGGRILEICAYKLSGLEITDTWHHVVDSDRGTCDLAMHAQLWGQPVTGTLSAFKAWLGEGEPWILLGNSVTFDRDWLKYHVPGINISYRVVDMSSVFRFMVLAGVPFERTYGGHRAKLDIDACLSDARRAQSCMYPVPA